MDVVPDIISKLRHNIIRLRIHDFDRAIGKVPKKGQMSNSRSNNGVPDIVKKLRQHGYQNGLKRYLAFIGSLHDHVL